MSSRRSGRASGASYPRDPSSPGESRTLTVKVAPSKSRQAPGGNKRGVEQFEGGEIIHGKRNRGARKSYVVDSSPDDDDEEEDEAEIEDDEDEEDEEDAEGEDAMDVDAEGDINMDEVRVAPTTIKVSRSTARGTATKVIPDDEDDEEEDDDDDDDELSAADSELADRTLGDDTMADEDAEGEDVEDEEEDEDAEGEDAEGEEIRVAGEEEEDEEEDDEAAAEAGLDSGLDTSRAGTPNVSKMTKRQRARFDEGSQEYMKLSDEVQAKKVFTAEELSMRRQEMARRRRNLSEKRNEEVKMETINKLLKKQAPKVSKKAAAAAAAADAPGEGTNKPHPAFVRWVSNRGGSRVSVPQEMIDAPAGKVFVAAKPGLTSGKMVEEVV